MNSISMNRFAAYRPPVRFGNTELKLDSDSANSASQSVRVSVISGGGFSISDAEGNFLSFMESQFKRFGRETFNRTGNFMERNRFPLEELNTLR